MVRYYYLLIPFLFHVQLLRADNKDLKFGICLVYFYCSLTYGFIFLLPIFSSLILSNTAVV